MPKAKTVDGPHPVDVHVGRRVRERRLALGYNQTELAQALGLTFQQVQKYEKGGNRISASKLFDIARFFETDIPYFFEGLATTRAEGVAEPAAPFDHGPAPTRQSLEIARLATQLTAPQQKLVLDLIRQLRRGET